MECFGRSIPGGFRPLYPNTNAAGICEKLEREFPQDGVGFRGTSSAKDKAEWRWAEVDQQSHPSTGLFKEQAHAVEIDDAAALIEQFVPEQAEDALGG